MKGAVRLPCRSILADGAVLPSQASRLQDAAAPRRAAANCWHTSLGPASLTEGRCKWGGDERVRCEAKQQCRILVQAQHVGHSTVCIPPKSSAPELHKRKCGRAHGRLHVDGQHLAILQLQYELHREEGAAGKAGDGGGEPPASALTTRHPPKQPFKPAPHTLTHLAEQVLDLTLPDVIGQVACSSGKAGGQQRSATRQACSSAQAAGRRRRQCRRGGTGRRGAAGQPAVLARHVGLGTGADGGLQGASAERLGPRPGAGPRWRCYTYLRTPGSPGRPLRATWRKRDSFGRRSARSACAARTRLQNTAGAIAAPGLHCMGC